MDGGDLPGLVVQLQHSPGVQTDDLHQRLGRLLQEVGGADGALEYAHRRLEPAEQGVEL